MSIRQTQYLFKPYKPSKAMEGRLRPEIFFFTYGGHYSSIEFSKEYPTAKYVGTAWISDWTWHLNVEGQPNIRRTFLDKWTPVGSTGSFPSAANAPFKGTFGYLFKISAEDNEAIHKKLCLSRLRMVQDVLYKASEKPEIPMIAKAVMYWDPRHTVDACKNVWKIDTERRMWRVGLVQLRSCGVPEWYLQKIIRHLNGEFMDVEPLQANSRLRPSLIPTAVSNSNKKAKYCDADARIEHGYDGNTGEEPGKKVERLLFQLPSRGKQVEATFDTVREQEATGTGAGKVATSSSQKLGGEIDGEKDALTKKQELEPLIPSKSMRWALGPTRKRKVTDGGTSTRPGSVCGVFSEFQRPN